MLQDKGAGVYTIHAEVEGIVHQPLFEDLRSFVHATRGSPLPSGRTSAPASPESLPLGQIVRGHIHGREGLKRLGCQQAASAS